MKKIKNPIILLGGFLITEEAYIDMRNTIRDFFKRDIYFVNITRNDWLKTNSLKGWSNILDKVEEKALNIINIEQGEKIDLIGHSSGGVILRLFLSNEIFDNKIYNGQIFTSNLITLGSPHQALRATKLRKFVDQKYPGSFFKSVNYISIGGKLKINSNETSLVSKFLAKRFYKSISGNPCEDGDGLVPLSSSLLEGSQKIVIQNSAHSGIFGKHWYGTPSNTKAWFSKIIWR
tara:strand:- start:6590 stop:7288 length:699 start_codon:yes stop_codon:yes gene_type:complete